jgi:hypothetical protein
MLHRLALAVLLLSAAPPARAQAARALAGGRIESDTGRFEVLGRPLRAGDRIDTPEGYLVVEEDDPDAGVIGSFGVVSAEVLAASAPRPSAPAGPPEPERAEAAALARPGAACRDERSAYLSELWRASGIDVKDPVALLEGLESGPSTAATAYWLALATDAFRPLAWSSELRSRADALARCARAELERP